MRDKERKAPDKRGVGGWRIKGSQEVQSHVCVYIHMYYIYTQAYVYITEADFIF